MANVSCYTLAIVAAILLQIASAVYNKDVTRTIDATSAIVKVTIDIKASDVSKKDGYDLVFPDAQAIHLSHLSVTFKNNELPVTAPVTNGNVTTYTVSVEETNPTLKVVAFFTSILEPYPKEITQADSQLVLLSDSHYFLSPYRTENQKTTIKLASSSVESYSKKAPSSHKGTSITYGPYKEVEALDYSPAKVHFVNNKPFAKFSTLQREVEVSHWGNVAFEEIYELKHAGAVLKGGFSRFDYQMKRQTTSPSFRSLIALLPLQANNIYYRDQIGNISTSDMKVLNEELELEIQTRFPIFGGWQTQFYIGYSVPTENTLFLDASGRFNLKFDYFTIFEDVWVEDMEIKVVLPEGASAIQVDLPYPAEQSRSVRYTYLDSEFNGGRPVIVIKAQNLVEAHDKQIVISYAFATSRMLVEPAMLVAAFFAFFVVCSALARVGEASSSKTDKTEATKAA